MSSVGCGPFAPPIILLTGEKPTIKVKVAFSTKVKGEMSTRIVLYPSVSALIAEYIVGINEWSENNHYISTSGLPQTCSHSLRCRRRLNAVERARSGSALFECEWIERRTYFGNNEMEGYWFIFHFIHVIKYFRVSWWQLSMRSLVVLACHSECECESNANLTQMFKWGVHQIKMCFSKPLALRVLYAAVGKHFIVLV